MIIMTSIKSILKVGSSSRMEPLPPTAFPARQWWWRRWRRGGGAEEPAEADDVQGEGCEENAWMEGSIVAQVRFQ